MYIDLGFDIVKIQKHRLCVWLKQVKQVNEKTIFHNELFVNSVEKSETA